MGNFPFNSLILWVFSLLFVLASTDKPFKSLLYGEELKGFLEMRRVSDGQYSLHFDIREGDRDGLRWSIHTSSAPYDIAVFTENCKRCKKSPQILRNQEMKDVTVEEGQIVGHTVVLEAGDKVLACATIIVPEYPLLQVSFHEDPIHGHIHIIPMKNRMRILPDLRYNVDYEASDPRAEVLDWAFVQDCESKNVEQSSEGTELGVDSRTTITLDTTGSNLTLENFALFRGGKPFVCGRLVDVEPKSVEARHFKFTQDHFYSATRWTSPEPVPAEIHVRDDCMDVSTQSLHRPLLSTPFFPSISIFGADTLMLKSLVPSPSTDPQKCLVLRPRFARPVAMTSFSHPIVGELVLVDTDDVIFVSGSLRHLFDESATRATIQVSPRFASPGGCPQYLQTCGDCFTLQDSALVNGKNDSQDVSLAGVLPYFNVSKMNSVIVDLTWTKVCANLTQLPSGAMQARANIRRYSPFSAPVVATVVLLEYPANNYTEIVVNKKVSVGEISVHERPVDMTVTGGPPCGELTIGPTKKVPWMDDLNRALTLSENDSTLLIEDRLISGPNSALSLSLLLTDSLQEKNVYCGHFSMSADPPTTRMAIFNDSIRGFVKLEQSPDPSGSFPTMISYLLENRDGERPFGNKDQTLDWEIVNEQNMSCASALIFNPTQANETECSPETEWRCPIGLKMMKLIPNKRVSIPVDLPLHGPFAVSDQSLRVNLRDGPICEPLIEMKQATLHWKTLSKRPLSDLQTELSTKWDLQDFQIQINYNRELIGGRCSTYRVTFLTTDEKLSAIFDAYLVEENRFKGEKALDCGGSASEETSKTATPVSPKAKSTSRIFSFSTQILNISLVLLTFGWFGF